MRPDPRGGLFTDLYELTMAQAYLEHGETARAQFEVFFRKMEGRNFYLAAGLDSVLEGLEQFRYTADDMDYLHGLGKFSDTFLDWLSGFRFSGSVEAMPEGTPVFANEPLLRVSAPMSEAQILETIVLNQVHFQTLAASKAARIALAAAGKPVFDFGARRAHGSDSALAAARGTWIGGLAGTSLLEAGRRYGIPVSGTMAHSFVQAHEDELEALRRFQETFPETTLLVDTYDTIDGVRHVIALARELGRSFRVKAIRLDSGDLLELSREARRLLDDAGLQHVKVLASGGLGEHEIAGLIAAGAPLDGFGVGTQLAVSSDVPAIDIAYKLVHYAGAPRAKFSARKTIYPGAKQVFRTLESGTMVRDTLAAADEELPGEPLLRPVMEDGRRLAAGREKLETVRERARAGLESLPERLRRLDAAEPAYPVEPSERLRRELHALKEKAGVAEKR